jgi:hypothetical protein
MPHRPIPKFLRNKLVIQAAVVFLLCVSSISAAKAQAAPPASPPPQTWTVTVDVSAGGNPPTYRYSNKTANCPKGTKQGGTYQRTLYVCTNELVLFKASPKSYDLYIYSEDPIFLVSGSTTSFVHFTDSSNMGVPIVSNAATAGTAEEYRVALIDKTKQILYVDDPQIVIGTGMNLEAIKHVEEQTSRLDDSCRSLSQSLVRSPDVKARVDDLCKKIHDLHDQVRRVIVPTR